MEENKPLLSKDDPESLENTLKSYEDEEAAIRKEDEEDVEVVEETRADVAVRDVMGTLAEKSISYGLICVVACLLLPVAAFVAFIVFGIYFMTVDVDVCEPYNPLWIYAVVSFIVFIMDAFIIILLVLIMPGESMMLKRLCATVILETAIFLYGTIILFTPGIICDDMKDEGLYIWVEIFYYIRLIAYCCLMCSAPCILTPIIVEMVIGDQMAAAAAEAEAQAHAAIEEAKKQGEEASKPLLAEAEKQKAELERQAAEHKETLDKTIKEAEQKANEVKAMAESAAKEGEAKLGEAKAMVDKAQKEGEAKLVEAKDAAAKAAGTK